MEDEDPRLFRTRDFAFEYRSNGNVCRLSVPVEIPYEKDKRELVQRLMKLHAIPPYEEDSLFDKLSHFIAEESLQEWGRQADEWLSNSTKVLKTYNHIYCLRSFFYSSPSSSAPLSLIAIDSLSPFFSLSFCGIYVCAMASIGVDFRFFIFLYTGRSGSKQSNRSVGPKVL